jgi:deoxyribodipyrimidine photo-lyase
MAAARGPVLPLYIDDTSLDSKQKTGGATRWWLDAALRDLGKNLSARGAELVLRRGDPAKIIFELASEMGAKHVAWSRCYEPDLRQRDDRLVADFSKQGIAAEVFTDYLLFEPGTIATNSGTPFRVFTPFSKACRAAPPPAKPLPAPKSFQPIPNIASDNLHEWKLVPSRAIWPKGLADAWEATETAAQLRLTDFIDSTLKGYKDQRDRMDIDGTSRLSPYLHFGMISPRQIWYAVEFALAQHPQLGGNAEKYLNEILWREFAWHLLFHYPHMIDKPLMAGFADFPWHHDAAMLTAWQKGQTGYPIVDAAMRQLWQTGWMHNRARMIVASFLVKHLLIDWRDGMAWFWDTLVDADLGSNTASWQWVAGCGADAAPYFRIFNPILQGQKFDPDGAYVRRFVPELVKAPTEFIHEPWAAPPLIVAEAGITLGKTYPFPIIDHNQARQRALAALASTKSDKT